MWKQTLLNVSSFHRQLYLIELKLWNVLILSDWSGESICADWMNSGGYLIILLATHVGNENQQSTSPQHFTDNKNYVRNNKTTLWSEQHIRVMSNNSPLFRGVIIVSSLMKEYITHGSPQTVNWRLNHFRCWSSKGI